MSIRFNSPGEVYDTALELAHPYADLDWQELVPEDGTLGLWGTILRDDEAAQAHLGVQDFLARHTSALEDTTSMMASAPGGLQALLGHQSSRALYHTIRPVADTEEGPLELGKAIIPFGQDTLPGTEALLYTDLYFHQGKHCEQLRVESSRVVAGSHQQSNAVLVGRRERFRPCAHDWSSIEQEICRRVFASVIAKSDPDLPRDRATIQTDLVHLLAQNGYFGQGHPIFAAAQHLTDEDISAHHLSRVDRRRGERSRRMNMGYLIGPLQQTLEEMRQNPSSPSHADLRPYAFDLSSRTKQDFFIKLVQYAVTPAFDVDAFSDLGAMRIVVHEAHYPGLTYLIDNTVRELFRFNPDHYDHNTHALDRYSGTMVDADKYIIQSAHHIPTPGMPYLIEIDNRTGRFRRERIDGEGNTSYYEAIHYAVQTPGGLRLELQLVQRDQHIRQQYQDPVVSHHVYKDSNRVDVMRAAHQVTLGDGRGPNLSELIVMGAIIENLRPSRNNILAAIGDTP